MKNNHPTSKIILVSMFVCYSFLLGPFVLCQGTDTGTLAGVVQDANGAALPGVNVSIVNIETGLARAVVTNNDGRWTLPVLPVGQYEVSFELQGFSTLKRAGVAVAATTTTTLNEKLGVGEISDLVTVTAEAPLIASETATTSRQITSRELESIPSTTRSFTHLLSTDTGASADLPASATNSTGNISPAINGARTTSSSLLFNGIDATNITNEGSLTENISPAPETISEVKLLTSLYDASVGRSGGGNIQLVTKSGGNAFNGSVYYFLQNEVLNANDFFYNRDGIGREKARRNEGGFTLGGPIIKDKLHFFGGYQRTVADTAYVPTAQSFVVLPEALRFIEGPRTPENIRAAFQRANQPVGLNNFPVGCITASANPCINRATDAGVRILNLINPVTGDYFIPSPRANAERLFTTYSDFDPRLPNRPSRTFTGQLEDRITQQAGGRGGNTLVRQRNVVPASFEQDQFTARLDHRFSDANSLAGTFFFANFPAFDPFPEFSLASPTTLKRNDRNRTLAITDTHVINPSTINELRFGFFFLDNTRSLDEPFLTNGLTNEDVGINNPARFFDQSDATRRLGHFDFTGNLDDLTFGAPNDVFNRREQTTMTFADNLTYIKGAQTLRFGVEAKRHAFDTNLPEEQGTEFERFTNFGQFLNGLAPEADTQFGITDKQFRFGDISFYATDDWKVTSRLTFNIGVRWDWFGWPTERNGRLSNFDFTRVTNPDDIAPGFILPSNVNLPGFNAIDASISETARVDNKHTLNGQDLNNFAPRFGFAYTPFAGGRTVIRGGYGIFFDRPSAAFMNTIYSNYPFLREIEVASTPYPTVPITNAFSEQNPNTPFSRYLPFRVIRTGENTGAYALFDSTPGVRSNQNIIDYARGRSAAGGAQLATGNPAEALEFRAIDRDLRTPYIQQWNFGIQQQFGSNWLVEARYIGTKGTKLLQAVGFNQPYDLNDPSTPDHIFRRINDAYERAYLASARPGNPNGVPGGPQVALRQGVSERERGRGIAYGGPNNALDGNLADGRAPFDYNVASPGGFFLISPDIRAPYLGLANPEAILLQSNANSIYNSGQISLTKRLSNNFQFNTSYTFSKSIDYGSTDPGSTAASGRPDAPNAGLVAQGDQRNLRSNRALSDFDRPHRFAGSFIFQIPTFGLQSRLVNGWQLSGFTQVQSGTPFSIFSAEPNFTSDIDFQVIEDQYIGYVNRGTRTIPDVGRLRQSNWNLGSASGGLYQQGFGRPSVRNLDLLRRQGEDITRQYFNTNQNPFDPETALTSALGGFGNLGRNVLRGPSQKRFDVGLAKSTRFTERAELEIRWDVFNVFNIANFANPNGDIQDETDFGQINRSVGGPRVMQFGAKVRF